MQDQFILLNCLTLLKLFCLGSFEQMVLKQLALAQMIGSRKQYYGVKISGWFLLIKYWLLAHFPSFTGKKQEADELSGDASMEDDAFVKVKC